MMPYGPYGAGPWNWGWMIGGWIMMLIFWALIIAGIVYVVRTLSHRGALGASSADEALAILRRRYAAGEISKDQFEEMKRTIGHGRAA